MDRNAQEPYTGRWVKPDPLLLDPGSLSGRAQGHTDHCSYRTDTATSPRLTSSGATKTGRKPHPRPYSRKGTGHEDRHISHQFCRCLAPPLFRMEGGSGLEVDAQFAREHRSGWIPKIILRDGAIRNIRLEGVGCLCAICSRTDIHAKDGTGFEVRTAAAKNSTWRRSNPLSSWHR